MKNFFKYVVAIAVFSFLFGCSSCGHQSPRYVILAHEITEKTGKELKAQKNLYLIGTGGGMMDDIQMMAMSFNYYQEVDLKKARELLVYVVSQYLLAINGNTEVRPYLHEYPFTAKNVEIRMWIYKPDRSRLTSDKIYYISAINGVLNYYIHGLEQYSRQTLCEETYQEALKMVKLQGV